MKYNVVVLGASAKPEKYSYKAVKMLSEHGYGVFPVHPAAKPIDGITCYPNLEAIPEPVDTITLYLGERNSTPIIEDIVRKHPRRLIMNPGAENDLLEEECNKAGIEVQKACTLVLLRTDQF